MRKEAEVELFGNILPFWKSFSVDADFGGFRGRISWDNQVDPMAPKGAVLNTRILWTFAAIFNRFADQKSKELADRAYAYLREFFFDRKNGGVYWLLDHKGRPVNRKKQIYAQAFAIYALAEFYLTSRKEEPINLAWEIFNLIEKHAWEEVCGGYLEAFSEDWNLLEDLRLSEKDQNEKKTMNTHLHVLEAYSTLLRVTGSGEVKKRLSDLVRIFTEKIIRREIHHLGLFFSEDWILKSDTISFGHDIESSWLLTEAAELLNDTGILNEARTAALEMADSVMLRGLSSEGALFYEGDLKDIVDPDFHWWPQLEAVVGFINAFEITGDEKYLQTAEQVWKYAIAHCTNRRFGEWFWRISSSGKPYLKEDKLNEWKGPYHVSRACIEIMRRTDSYLESDSG
jgi:mannobiose 2-epimerase